MSDFEKVSVEHLFRLDGDAAFVTGGGGGLGRMAALALAGAGAQIAVTDIDGASAERVANEICSEGGNALSFELDVSKRRRIDEVIDQAASRFGGLQILVNNAGITRHGPSEEMSDEDWDAVVEVNMSAPFVCSRAAARHMLKDGEGRIVSIASIMGLRGNPIFPHIPYQASKGALVNMTRALAVEWAPRGVRVNAIAPTFFYTDLSADMRKQNPQRVAEVEARTPMGRYGQPEEIAGGILYLASKASSMVTGHTLAIDGGWLAT